MDIKVLHEDNHLIAVFKPAGVLSQGDETGDISIFDEVKEYIKHKKYQKYMENPPAGGKKPGNIFLGLLHRLDRPVSGIILFAKTSKGASRLSEQFRNHKVEKIYHAMVCGRLKTQKGTLTHFLIKDEKLKKGREAKDGKEANLYYEVIRSNTDYSLLKIKIEGGQFHQIRTQLSIAGFPVLGDVKYLPGGRQVKGRWNNEKAIALCATQLSFYPATSDKLVVISIELPEEWKEYIRF
ncbi:MAG: hypothetical protein A3D34_02935 [Candidatus Staskawiczbacteria bacterium RIFCSPHIGHO2_02_FULL_33_16]|uniref:Pseudouridine synthase RsuA/RluA-like domain-containing protein n=1 Tax=Candidatus Staskawiczbacteria bacterium RIFCSPHIGHO2_02_FULL_33_16 TaxID=1802204 RepID=A0A1G2HTF7_9BACT|nr:MAG: hypothetical protein A3D34_02935 [Candidatus Staskawiczbacteria bacterium RIFCSPHIGHO2_02_FULL_33_16]OGZ70169.1 MAG: hypothetical protein A2980_00600 [Candidatus Staskawiczbacteria bacterium RIFCSPLOWO2_01_FULL_33_13]